MINNSLPRFPQSLGDTFAKSWITYKSLWFVFFCFMLLFHLPAVLIFFAFQKPENLLFSIHFTDFSRFYISKMGDAFACFLLPLFLKNQLPSLTYVFKKFFSKYLLKLSLVVLLLYILKTQFFISPFNVLILALGLVFSFVFIFVVFFIVVDAETKFFEPFKASFLLCQLHTKKILVYFFSAFIFIKTVSSFLLVVFFFNRVDLFSPNSDNIVKLQENLLLILQSTEFYLINSFLHILLQPFLSIFLCILFYSLWVNVNQQPSKS